MPITLTMSQDDLAEITRTRDAALEKVGQLEAKLASLRLGDAGSHERLVWDVFEAACPLVRFLVANVSPMTVRKWPTAPLRHFAALLRARPGASALDIECAEVFEEFAKRADEIGGQFNDLITRFENAEPTVKAALNRGEIPELVAYRMVGQPHDVQKKLYEDHLAARKLETPGEATS